MPRTLELVGAVILDIRPKCKVEKGWALLGETKPMVVRVVKKFVGRRFVALALCRLLWLNDCSDSDL